MNIKKGMVVFHRKNKISCCDVSMWTVAWEYICWVLGGKPEGKNGYRIYKGKSYQ